MSQKKAICLTDIDGQIRWFDADELATQIIQSGIIPDRVINGVVSKFVQEVKDVLDEQQAYFKASGDQKPALLNRCKNKEAALRKKIGSLMPTIQQLSNI